MATEKINETTKNNCGYKIYDPKLNQYFDSVEERNEAFAQAEKAEKEAAVKKAKFEEEKTELKKKIEEALEYYENLCDNNRQNEAKVWENIKAMSKEYAQKYGTRDIPTRKNSIFSIPGSIWGFWDL